MKSARFKLILLLVILTLLSLGLAPGSKRPGDDKQAGLLKPMTRGDYLVFDANNISTYIRNNGSFNRDPGTGNAGFEWPKGTGNTAIYASGLWIGGKVGGDIRVAIAEYSYEYDAGVWGAADPEDPHWKVYKIKRGDNASNNPDYADWPVADGAPVDAEGKPLLLGDMTVWTVFNDGNEKLHSNQATLPVGVEVQLTAFAFNRADALGNTIYYRWKIINKGGQRIDSTYICIWADPDVGDSGDDYDGCDTTLGIGYTYNGAAVDGVYGSTCPATGFDFLQGPLVPGAPTDTARFPDGRVFPGKKLLKMTSYLKYSNDATDLGNPNVGSESYNYFKGLTRTGKVILDAAGNPSTFMYSGDPNKPAGPTNWIETGATGDRRFMMSSGPFTMAPGDTQEIVGGNLIASGATVLNSVTALKSADAAVQLAYDLNFSLAAPPKQPEVAARPLDREIVLSWGENNALATEIENTVTLDKIAQAGGAQFDTYNFEGYVVYQFANASGENPQIVRTFDLKVNPQDPAIPSAGVIYDNVFDNSLGALVYKPVKFGSNSGIERSIKITQDKLTNTPLVNDKDYYFAVTAYTYNKESIPRTLESATQIITIRPRQAPGTRFTSAYGDTAKGITHVTGVSEATIVPVTVDPSLLTGHSYQITIDTTGGMRSWRLHDATASKLVTTSENFGPKMGGNDWDYPIADGLQWFITDPPPGPNPDTSLTKLIGSAWMEGNNFSNVPPAVIVYGAAGDGIITTAEDLPSYLSNMATAFPTSNLVPIEVRFGPGQVQKAYRLRRAGGVGTQYVIQATNPFVDVPFTVWDISNAASPRQLTVSWRDQSNDAIYNPDLPAASGLEIAFIYYRTYNPAGGQWPYQNAPGLQPADWSNVCTAKPTADMMYGMSLVTAAGRTFNEAPATLRVITYKLLTAADTYTVAGPAAPAKSAELAKADIDLIKAVPNPYFGANAYEKNQFGRVVRFTHLPEVTTLRIFNLAGELIQVINKSGPETTADWDLTNKNSLPVASGMYIVYVDVPNVGTKVLKIAVIMAEERLDNF